MRGGNATQLVAPGQGRCRRWWPGAIVGLLVGDTRAIATLGDAVSLVVENALKGYRARMRTAPVDTAAQRTDAGQRRTWWVSFAIMVVIGSSWALASPLFSYPDEPAHVIYAAGAVRGGLFGTPNGQFSEVSVPASYTSIENPTPCFAFEAERSAACLPPLRADVQGEARVGTLAGRYPPLYYLYAGLPSLVATGAMGIYLMRVMTVLLSAALLASAIASARARTRNPWPLAGLVLAMTPMVLYFMGAVNPQGPEIAAGVGLWTAGIAVLARADSPGAHDHRMRTRLVLRMIVAAAVLATVRPVAPIWLVVIVFSIMVAYMQWSTLRALSRLRTIRIGVPVIAVLACGTAAWVLLRDFLQPEKSTFSYISSQHALTISFERIGYWLRQMVGILGWLDTDLPAFTYNAWTGMIGLILLLALAYGGKRGILAICGLIAAGIIISMAAEFSSYAEHGFGWQGRYVLPLFVGVPILAGQVLHDRAGIDTRTRRRLVVLVVALAGVAQFVGFRAAMNRYTHGRKNVFDVSPDGPLWAPPLGSVLLTVVFGLVLLVGAAALWAAVRESGVGHVAAAPLDQTRMTVAPHAPLAHAPDA